MDLTQMLTQECLKEAKDVPDGTVYLYLEARTQLCTPCSLLRCFSMLSLRVMPSLIVVTRFKRWGELPEKIDSELAEFCPATTNILTKEDEKKRKFQRKCGKRHCILSSFA